MTAHKCQGQTIKVPGNLVVDLASCFQAGQGHVMLGRIQNSEQLYLKSFCTKSIYANPQALQEAIKMEKRALNNIVNLRKNIWNNIDIYNRKIISLNVQNLGSNLDNLKANPTVLQSDIICLQETCFERDNEIPMIPDYTCKLSEEKQRKEVVIYIKNNLAQYLRKTDYIMEEFIQAIKLSFEDYDVITIYIPPNENNSRTFQKVVKILSSLISTNKPTILNGNFNFNYWQEQNKLSEMLNKNGFTQIVNRPTTYSGKCNDHVYVKKFNFTHKLYYPYYTDHEAICVVLRKSVCDF